MEEKEKGSRKGVGERDKKMQRGNMNAAGTFDCTIK